MYLYLFESGPDLQKVVCIHLFALYLLCTMQIRQLGLQWLHLDRTVKHQCGVHKKHYVLKKPLSDFKTLSSKYRDSL